MRASRNPQCSDCFDRNLRKVERLPQSLALLPIVGISRPSHSKRSPPVPAEYWPPCLVKFLEAPPSCCQIEQIVQHKSPSKYSMCIRTVIVKLVARPSPPPPAACSPHLPSAP